MALSSLAIMVGAAGILAVVVVLRRIVMRRRFGRGGFGHGGPWGRRRGIGRSFWLRAVFSRLDTTPGQEREIRAALEEMRERAVDAKRGLPETRASVARAISGESFDDGALEAVSARIDATTEKMKDALASTLRRIHGTLDARQRERLAALVSEGFHGWHRGGWGGGGPYRNSELL